MEMLSSNIGNFLLMGNIGKVENRNFPVYQIFFETRILDNSY